MATAAAPKHWHTELKSVFSSLKAVLADPASPTTTDRNEWDTFTTLKPSLSQGGPPIPQAALKKLLKEQVLLKVWRTCSALAATSSAYKAAAAVYLAHSLLAALRDAGVLLHYTPDSTATPVLGPAATRIARDVKQQLIASGLLQQLPALVTDAALQLQAAAGVRPATEVQHVSMADGACGSTSHPASGSHAENQAVNIISLMFMIHHLAPVFSDSSNLGASCLPPTQHLALAIWQYLSTVPALLPNQQGAHAASSSSQHSTVLTEAQLALSSLAWELTAMCSNAVSAALDSQRPPCNSTASPACISQSKPVGREARSPQGSNVPQASTADAAVRTRHHMECLCLQTVSLQLVLLIKCKQKQEQQERASSSAACPSAEQLISDLEPQVPAPLQRMLRQLGCSPRAALWQAQQMLLDGPGWSCSQIELRLIQAAERCISMRELSKRFLLDSTPSDLPQSLLLELQQHLQLHMLLPGVLLQWVAGKPSSDSNYTECCYQAALAAQISANMYPRVLHEGPPSLYQHMTGHRRPHLGSGIIHLTSPADSQLIAAVPIPADVHKSRLQLLEQLLSNLVQLWRSKHSEQLPSSSGPGNGAAARTAGSSSSQSSSSSTPCAGPGEADNDLFKAIMQSGIVAIQMAMKPPTQDLGSQITDSVGASAIYSSATSSAAGKLCAMLENVVRVELAAEQEAATKAAMRGNAASTSSQRDIPEKSVRRSLLGCFTSANVVNIAGCQSMALVDTVLAHHEPGSRPCMQLCSLLATLLKCSAWDGSLASADAERAKEAAFSCEIVAKAACAVIEAATAEVGARQHGQSAASGALGGSSACSNSSNAAHKGAEAVLPLVVGCMTPPSGSATGVPTPCVEGIHCH